MKLQTSTYPQLINSPFLVYLLDFSQFIFIFQDLIKKYTPPPKKACFENSSKIHIDATKYRYPGLQGALRSLLPAKPSRKRRRCCKCEDGLLPESADPIGGTSFQTRAFLLNDIQKHCTAPVSQNPEVFWRLLSAGA